MASVQFDVRHVRGGWSGPPLLASIVLPRAEPVLAGRLETAAGPPTEVWTDGGLFYVRADPEGPFRERDPIGKKSHPLFRELEAVVRDVLESDRSTTRTAVDEIGESASRGLAATGRIVRTPTGIMRVVQGVCWSLARSHDASSAGYFVEDAFGHGTSYRTLASVDPRNPEHREILSRHVYGDAGSTTPPVPGRDAPEAIWARPFDARRVLAGSLLGRIASGMTGDDLRIRNIDVVSEIATCMRLRTELADGSQESLEDACAHLADFAASDLADRFSTPSDTRAVAVPLAVLADLTAATPALHPAPGDPDDEALSSGF